MNHVAVGQVAPSVRSYRPGDWFGIIGERAVVILPPSEKPRVAALWELVDGGAGFDVTLDALISGGLRELPGFVLVSTGEGETKVVLRGPARAEFVVGGELVQLEGSSATTWVERTLLDVSRMSIVLTEGDDELPAYAVDGGLFRLSRLEENPAHEGADELGEEPAYETEFPLEDEVVPEPEPFVERSPEPPAWTPAPPAPSAPPPPPPLPVLDLDHDGETQTGAWAPPPAATPGIPGQEPAPDVTVPVARLVVSNGDVVDVDRAIVIGRAPEARRVNDTEEPRLLTVPSPNLEISSTHLEIRPGSGVDHGTAVATDLASTNGTVVVQPGIGPEDLAAGVPVQLVFGALIDLGDGVTIQVTKP